MRAANDRGDEDVLHMSIDIDVNGDICIYTHMCMLCMYTYMHICMFTYTHISRYVCRCARCNTLPHTENQAPARLHIYVYILDMCVEKSILQCTAANFHKLQNSEN